jgi:predicted anti-sigma-YlaC factor YlaD
MRRQSLPRRPVVALAPIAGRDTLEFAARTAAGAAPATDQSNDVEAASGRPQVLSRPRVLISGEYRADFGVSPVMERFSGRRP